IADLSLSISDVASLLLTFPVRFWESGLGWMEGFEYASPITGRCYDFHASWWDTQRMPIMVLSGVGDPADVIAELFECLAIDSADTAYLKVPMRSRWKLLRRDDNGHPFEVARFSGRAKALKKLGEFENRAHKQTYWLESCDGD